jgi:hypothetical protein
LFAIFGYLPQLRGVLSAMSNRYYPQELGV